VHDDSRRSTARIAYRVHELHRPLSGAAEQGGGGVERGQQVFQPRVSPALISAQLYLSLRKMLQPKAVRNETREARQAVDGGAIT
jgi:hypothetical protein